MSYVVLKIFVSLLCLFTFLFVIYAHQVNAASFQIGWIDNSENEDGFSIERKLQSNGTYAVIATVGPNVTSYIDSSLANSTAYCYRVNAFNGAGDSAYTNEACGTPSATTSPPGPSAPGNTVFTNIANGAILSGSSVAWTATASGSPVRVEFFIDSALSWTEYAEPYQFNGTPSGTLNSTNLSNSSHQLTVRATYSDSSTAEISIAVIIANGGVPAAPPPPPPAPPPASGNTITTNLVDGAVLSGSSVPWTAIPSGSPVRVEFFIDSALSWTEYAEPYQFNGTPSGTLNSTNLSNSSHQLTVRATYSDSSTAEQTVAVSVDNNLTSLASIQLASCTNLTMGASKACTTSSQSALLPTVMIGIFRPQSGEWFLDRNGNGQWDGCAVDTCISSFGQPGDLPAIGNWSGGATSNIGTFNSMTGRWQLDHNGNGQWDGCAVDFCTSSLGQPGDLPVTRKIGAVNRTIMGAFQSAQNLWRFDINGNNAFDGCSVDECIADFGAVDDIPVVGDWNGLGTDAIGVFRPSTGQWFLDGNDNSRWETCAVEYCVLQPFGDNGTLPIVGDWNGGGTVKIGFFRSGTGEWVLDMNGNGQFDGCSVDTCLGPFGHSGDLPVVGKW
jgi:hypothetical protein